MTELQPCGTTVTEEFHTSNIRVCVCVKQNSLCILLYGKSTASFKLL